MTLAEKDKLDEILEYFHLKLSELKMTASETVEDEIKVLQDVIKFAQQKLEESSGEVKEKIQEVIDFSEEKIEELRLKTGLGSDEAKEIIASTADQMDKLIDELRKSDVMKKVGDVAKSVGDLLSTIGRKVGKSASDLSRVIALRTDLSRLNSRRRELVTQIGEMVHKRLSETGSLVLTEELLKLSKEVEKLDTEIKAKKEELKRVGKEEDLSEEQINTIIKEADQG